MTRHIIASRRAAPHAAAREFMVATSGFLLLCVLAVSPAAAQSSSPVEAPASFGAAQDAGAAQQLAAALASATSPRAVAAAVAHARHASVSNTQIGSAFGQAVASAEAAGAPNAGLLASAFDSFLSTVPASERESVSRAYAEAAGESRSASDGASATNGSMSAFTPQTPGGAIGGGGGSISPQDMALLIIALQQQAVTP